MSPPIHFPQPNSFIAENFDIKPKNETNEIPVLVREEAHCKIWHKQDSTFNRPKGNFF